MRFLLLAFQLVDLPLQQCHRRFHLILHCGRPHQLFLGFRFRLKLGLHLGDDLLTLGFNQPKLLLVFLDQLLKQLVLNEHRLELFLQCDRVVVALDPFEGLDLAGLLVVMEPRRHALLCYPLDLVVKHFDFNVLHVDRSLELNALLIKIGDNGV